MRRPLTLAAILAVAAGTALTAQASPAHRPVARSPKIEARLDAPGLLGAFVSFDHPVGPADIRRLQGLGIVKLHAFRLIPTVAVVAPLSTLERAAAFDDVTTIRSNDPVRFLTDKSKHAVRVDEVRHKLHLTGKGVTVADIDSGLDSTHQDFDGRIAKLLNFEGSWIYDNPQDGRFTDRLAVATGRYAGIDDHGHGTHTASTILGSGAASLDDADYSGMAPDAKLVVMKIAGAHQGALYDIGYEINSMLAIEYAVEHRKELGIRIVNNSWGVFETDDPTTEPIVLMVNAAVDHGLTMVFAAGNSGPGRDTVGWPGAAGKVITVAATAKTAPYKVAGYSSRGYQVDIAAPGSDIFAARGKTQVATGPEDLLLSAPEAGVNAPFYMAISGTSMATPHIVGIAALMFEANPKLTPPVVEEVLERTAVDLGKAGKDKAYGWGFVDAYRAVLVADCLGSTPKAQRESCFVARKALAASKWRSDYGDPGDKSETEQGSDLL